MVVVAPTPTLTPTLTLKGGEPMKRLVAFVVMVVGLGMVLSGCVANGFRDTLVKDSYIQKNYIDKVKVPKSKVVGDRNIKFYVGKVVDKRKDKAVWVKRIGFDIRTGDTEFANTQKTIRNITKKALLATGWGVVDNESKADFIVNTTLKDFKNYWGLILNAWATIDSDICVLSKNKGNAKVLNKDIHLKKAVIIRPDFTVEYKFAAGKLSKIYYTALINYFSSPEFVKAIEKAYREENDNSTVSH